MATVVARVIPLWEILVGEPADVWCAAQKKEMHHRDTYNNDRDHEMEVTHSLQLRSSAAVPPFRSSMYNNGNNSNMKLVRAPSPFSSNSSSSSRSSGRASPSEMMGPRDTSFAYRRGLALSLQQPPRIGTMATPKPGLDPYEPY